MPGTGDEFNQTLEQAGRVADFLEFAELLCRDALHRNESCGGHFREEYQTARRRGRSATTRTSATSAAWEFTGDRHRPRVLHKEPLEFDVRPPAAADGATQ